MARSLDDDAPRRISDADDHLSAEQRQAEADEHASLRRLRHDVRQTERDLTRRRRRIRTMGVALAVAGGAVLAGVLWTVLTWGSPSRFLRVDITCAVVALVSGAAAWVAAPPRGQLSLAQLEDMLATNREGLRFLSALIHPTLKERRSLYREDVAGVIEQHRTDSRKYRLIHNTLQNLIMIGAASTTTVAALDTRNQFTWQNITIVAIGFTVTLAAAFTGYYKYRERSYFLLQTADAIEEEANAFTLGRRPLQRLRRRPGAAGTEAVHPARRRSPQRAAAPPAAAGPARRPSPPLQPAAGMRRPHSVGLEESPGRRPEPPAREGQ
ncbi:SLATT domain-containing protein [Streptomyces globosus]|uniref:SLATT domain-containing protein n=1 Tax=Streptomyces globosus TaxID=68209 RepID=UPI003633CE04